MGIVERYLSQLKTEKRRWWRAAAILTVLSLLVALGVSWNLRLTGITIANSAMCGQTEHRHSEECPTEQVLICGYDREETGQETEDAEKTQETAPPEESGQETEASAAVPPEETQAPTEESDPTRAREPAEGSTATQPEKPRSKEEGEQEPIHVHTEACYETRYLCGFEAHTHSLSCYSDASADVETAEIWEATLPELTGKPGEDLLLVARSQLGYCESEKNYTVGTDPEDKQGITRYGQWYGNPYGDWSNMFTSFCLRYSGLGDLPINSGAEVMRLRWVEEQRYHLPQNYKAVPGDLVFLDKNGNGTADSTAIVVTVEEELLQVIEGDVEKTVAQTAYPLYDGSILGYGMVQPERRLQRVTAALSQGTALAKTTDYDPDLFTEDNSFVFYVESGGRYYAFDGNGKAVEIYLSDDGSITTDADNPDLLLWTLSASGSSGSYLIRNVSSGRYMHAFPNNGSGVTTTGAYTSTLIQSGEGIYVRSNSEYAMLNTGSGSFVMTQNQSSAALYRLGISGQCTVWLDGTNGGLMSLMGSENSAHSVQIGGTVQLPTQWQSPEKYSYVLQGWYDVKNSRYYPPGAEVTVTENLVFYADWIAATYDIGQYNSYVTDTVSTGDFIDTHLFDYNMLFNVYSLRPTVSANASGHSESWQQVTSGTVPYQNGQTLDFDFLDYDGSGDISYPNNRNSNNVSGDIYPGLYNRTLAELLFGRDNLFDPATGEGVMGKTYVGPADHLFQRITDPSAEYCGYYYYDSKLNAASYSQADERFYVYNYLERTSDSEKDGGDGGYSDFLPFNSPYANTNGKVVNDFNYGGENGEYGTTVHYQYDAKYNTNNNNTNQVGTNYSFGMHMDISFYLPNDPGTTDVNGDTGNRDIYGNEMHFYFSGDDDVWVLLDGVLMLDIGGVHGIESGDINFSTGIVTANGAQTGTLSGITEGEHTLTVYYLERGSSQSNCSILFNLAPRFSLTIQKEDVLSQELLDGAQFSVYEDMACTVPCELWESEAAYRGGAAATNTFTVTDGKATMWGLSSSKTYYIRETHPPDQGEYTCASGIICLTLDKSGFSSYSVEIREENDAQGNPIPVSNGFTVHGFRIDEKNQAAYIVVTNAPDWVKETTSVQVEKQWGDTVDHSQDAVTVYLNLVEPDGTVRNLRQTVLQEANDWRYVWTNLPKYGEDGETELVYTVSESYVQGYSPQIQRLEELTVTTEAWAESYTFNNGGIYLLRTDSGCLATTSAQAETLCFMEEAAAKSSPNALWTAAVSGSYVVFTNQNGQILHFNYGYLSSWRYFSASTGTPGYQNITPVEANGGLRLYHRYGSYSNYYICALNSSSYAAANTNSSSALTFHPLEKTTQSSTVEIQGFAYRITNVPLEEETSLRVTKKWQHPTGNQSLYEKEQVTVRLLANGEDTGRTVTLSLRNGWTDVFLGLPYTDEEGNVILYTVEETWQTEDWIPVYDAVTTLPGEPPSYETSVTNIYRWSEGVSLPPTGGIGLPLYMLCGLGSLLGPLVYGFGSRRRRGRRERE